MYKAILGVNHDLSTLYHGCFIVLWALMVYSAKVSSYKKATTPLCQNTTHNRGEKSLFVFFFSLSSSWSTYAHLWKIDMVDVS
jgi:hypothetical protein